MYSNALRMMAGYSRFVLQEERKHDMHTSFLLKNILPHTTTMPHVVPFYMRNFNFLQNSQLTPSKSYISNLNIESNQFDKNVAIVGHVTHEHTQNETYTLQYQANNGIQDRLVASNLKSIDAQIICVFDGHGGDKLSDYCANNIVSYIDSFIQKNKNMEKYTNDFDKLIAESLKYSYQKLDNDFYENVYKNLVALNNRKIKNTGTCALTIIICNNKIYVANCGDSEAIVVSQDTNGSIIYTELNERLSVNNPAERERLRKQFPNDQDIVVEQINGCYYIKGRLQPTRAIGDYYLKHSHLYKGKGTFNGPYIKSEPDIKIFPVKGQYKTIVAASDGIWDFLSKKVVAQASLKPNPHKQILQQALSKIAQINNKSVQQIKQVEAGGKRDIHDDISIAVVALGNNSKQQKLI